MLDFVRKAVRALHPAALVLLILALPAPFGVVPTLGQSTPLPGVIDLPGNPALDPHANVDDPIPSFLSGVGKGRVDTSKFRAAYPDIVASVPTTTEDVKAFCTKDEREQYVARYVTAGMEEAAALSKAFSDYKAAVALRIAQISANDGDRRKFLVEERAWANKWETFADRLVATLRGVQRRLNSSPVIECQNVCTDSIFPLPLAVGADDAQHLPGRSFKYENGKPGDAGYFAMNVTVRPGISCSDGIVGVSVFGGSGAAHQLNYFKYDPIAGIIPGYPDIYPDQQVAEVIFEFVDGAPKRDGSPSYSAEIPTPARPLEKIEMRFRNGQRDANNELLFTTISWP